MGSSSTFVCALLRALTCLRGIEADHHKIAEMAIELEQVWMKEVVGCQDQVAAAFGGLNIINFHQHGRFDVNPIRAVGRSASASFAGSNLMLFFPGRSRFSSDAASSVTQGLSRRSNSVRRMVAMVEEGTEILRHGDLNDFGHLLHEAWELKRGLERQDLLQRDR